MRGTRLPGMGGVDGELMKRPFWSTADGSWFRTFLEILISIPLTLLLLGMWFVVAVREMRGDD